MTAKNMMSNYRKAGSDFVFMRMDTLTERLRRMRALNSSPANIGLTEYAGRGCGFSKPSGKK